MSIEAHLVALTDALNKNTEVLAKMTGVTPSGTTAPAASGGKGGKGSKGGEPETVKVTQEMVNAALIKIKDDFGMSEAKSIIKEVGKAEKMAEIKPAQYQAVFDAANKKHAELSAGKGSGTDSDDDI